MGFKPGQSGNPAGKAKGTLDKTTRLVKQAILEAFYDDRVGGVQFLIDLATGDHHARAAFCRLLEKVVPGELKVEGDLSGPVQVFVVTGIEQSPGATTAELPAGVGSAGTDPH